MNTGNRKRDMTEYDDEKKFMQKKRKINTTKLFLCHFHADMNKKVVSLKELISE
jgi:hypothetical protein